MGHLAWNRKRVLTFVTLALCALVAATAGITVALRPRVGATTPPSIEFSTEEHDFGRIGDEDVTVHDFVFTNRGGNALRLGEIKTACSCTVAKSEGRETPPGGSGAIRISFDPKGRKGTVTSSILVYTNDPARSSVVLKLRADVVPRVEVSPSAVRLGKVRPGEIVRAEVTLDAAEALSTISIGNVSSTNNQLQVQGTSGGNSGKQQTAHVSLQIELRVAPGTEAGALHSTLVIKVSAPAPRTVAVPVVAEVVSDLESFPALVSVQEGKPDTVFETELTLTSRSGRPFKLKTVRLESPDKLSADGRPSEMSVTTASPTHRVRISGTTPHQAGGFRAMIVLETDAAGSELVRVPLQGSVRDGR